MKYPMTNIQYPISNKKHLAFGIWHLKFDIPRKRDVGFTLIELIIVLGLVAILASIGIASYVTYSRKAQFASSISSFKTFLFTARSKALAQVKEGSICGSNSSYTLQGFQVLLCCSGVKCPTSCHTSNIDYELDITCTDSSSNQYVSTVLSGKFPSSLITGDKISVDSSNTTSTSFLFTAVDAAVTNAAGQSIYTGPGYVTLQGYGQSQKITVSQTGVIQ